MKKIQAMIFLIFSLGLIISIVASFDLRKPEQREKKSTPPLNSDYERAQRYARPIGYFHKAFDW
jgi:hypothetical protein